MWLQPAWVDAVQRWGALVAALTCSYNSASRHGFITSAFESAPLAPPTSCQHQTPGGLHPAGALSRGARQGTATT